MDISDRRLTKSALFEDMLHNLDSCTTENLSKLINGYQDSEDTYIPGMPEFKIFFLDSIKKINGGSDMATPDLYDTLTGGDDIPSSSLEIYYQETGKIKDTIYERLTDPQKKNDPEYASLIQTIEERGIVYVTDNFFTKLMKTINNIDIVLSNGSITNLQAMGIGKSREIDSIRNEALATIIKSLRTGLHYSSAG